MIEKINHKNKFNPNWKGGLLALILSLPTGLTAHYLHNTKQYEFLAFLIVSLQFGLSLGLATINNSKKVFSHLLTSTILSSLCTMVAFPITGLTFSLIEVISPPPVFGFFMALLHSIIFSYWLKTPGKAHFIIFAVVLGTAGGLLYFGALEGILHIPKPLKSPFVYSTIFTLTGFGLGLGKVETKKGSGNTTAVHNSRVK